MIYSRWCLGLNPYIWANRLSICKVFYGGGETIRIWMTVRSVRAGRVSSAPRGIYCQCSSDALPYIFRRRESLPPTRWRVAGFMYGSLGRENSSHPRGFSLPPGQAKGCPLIKNQCRKKEKNLRLPKSSRHIFNNPRNRYELVMPQICSTTNGAYDICSMSHTKHQVRL